MTIRCTTVFVRAYDLHFDKIALNANLTHEEKIRFLVLLQHVWTDGKEIFSEGIPREQFAAEIEALRLEIESRIAEAA